MIIPVIKSILMENQSMTFQLRSRFGYKVKLTENQYMTTFKIYVRGTFL